MWSQKLVSKWKLDFTMQDILGTQADVGWLEELEWSPALGKEPNSSPELWWADGLSSVKSPGCKYKLRDDKVVWLWSVLNRSVMRKNCEINVGPQFYVIIVDLLSNS